ncbi:alpha/beta hydrolase [Halobacillus mangrovi]|uniref:Alpha/beta hydrolase n=1 Tax=Halobacillus mangrovi TaxID=402384 RepID=A0A1W5ZRF9_9BACI|nr:alpha/beta hydrolase [Halobacillus mangrovi]ARI75874.1 alpha/beta hydrolase [Halobacillus mangrovi]
MWKWLPGMIVFLLLITSGCGDDPNGKKEGDKKMKVEDIAGEWRGAIQVPNQPLDIEVTFEKDNGIKGSITIPAQNVEGFSLTDIQLQEHELSFQMPVSGQSLVFNGVVEGDDIKGTFTQAGQSFPFNLKKSSGDHKSKQDEEEFMTVETDTGTLYGSVVLPRKGDVFPVALIIPGSGPTDRNGNGPGGKNNSLKFLAEQLAAQGIASVRYDKRGAGKNAQAIIPQEEIRFEQFIEDAGRWMEKINRDARFNKLAVIGHSQGSLVGMAGAKEADVDAFVSIAGAGRSIDQILNDQLKDSLPEDAYQESLSILDALRNGDTVPEVSNSLQSVFHPSIQPFLMSWMEYDPQEIIKSLEVPVLLVSGEHDIQVPVKDAELLKEAQPEAELLVIEKMNHVLKEAPEEREENLKTYGDPSKPLAEGLVQGIVEFLKENGFN